MNESAPRAELIDSALKAAGWAMANDSRAQGKVEKLYYYNALSGFHGIDRS